MQTQEKIKVYICIENGKTICICAQSNKGCGRYCAKDTVLRDKFQGWEKTMKRNKYGK